MANMSEKSIITITSMATVTLKIILKSIKKTLFLSQIRWS